MKNKDDDNPLDEFMKDFLSGELGLDITPEPSKADKKREEMEKMKAFLKQMEEEKKRDDKLKDESPKDEFESEPLPFEKQYNDGDEKTIDESPTDIVGDFLNKLDDITGVNKKHKQEEKPMEEKVISKRPVRDTIIQEDEIVNLKIDLQSSETVNDFLNKIGIETDV